PGSDTLALVPVGGAYQHESPSNDTLAIVPVGWTYPDQRAGGSTADAPERAPTDVPPLDVQLNPIAPARSRARESASAPRSGVKRPALDDLQAPPTTRQRTEPSLAPSNEALPIVPVGWIDRDQRAGPSTAD